MTWPGVTQAAQKRRGKSLLKQVPSITPVNTVSIWKTDHLIFIIVVKQSLALDLVLNSKQASLNASLR